MSAHPQAIIEFWKGIRAPRQKVKQRAIFETPKRGLNTNTPEKLKAYRQFLLDAKLSKGQEYRTLLSEAVLEYDRWMSQDRGKTKRGRPKGLHPIACGWRGGDEGILTPTKNPNAKKRHAA